MRLTRIVVTETAPELVADYLCDFTTTNEWDPGTVKTELISGDGGPGTRYRNVSRFLGRESELVYTVEELEPGRRIALVGENKSVTAHDTMTFEPQGRGTRVTYVVDFEFRGFVGFIEPLLAPALTKLADRGQAGMQQALARL